MPAQMRPWLSSNTLNGGVGGQAVGLAVGQPHAAIEPMDAGAGRHPDGAVARLHHAADGVEGPLPDRPAAVLALGEDVAAAGEDTVRRRREHAVDRQLGVAGVGAEPFERRRARPQHAAAACGRAEPDAAVRGVVHLAQLLAHAGRAEQRHVVDAGAVPHLDDARRVGLHHDAVIAAAPELKQVVALGMREPGEGAACGDRTSMRTCLPGARGRHHQPPVGQRGQGRRLVGYGLDVQRERMHAPGRAVELEQRFRRREPEPAVRASSTAAWTG